MDSLRVIFGWGWIEREWIKVLIEYSQMSQYRSKDLIHQGNRLRVNSKGNWDQLMLISLMNMEISLNSWWIESLSQSLGSSKNK